MKLCLGLAVMGLLAVSNVNAMHSNASAGTGGCSSLDRDAASRQQQQQRQAELERQQQHESSRGVHHNTVRALSFWERYRDANKSLLYSGNRANKAIGASAIVGNLAMIYTAYRLTRWMFGSKKRHHKKS